MPPPVSPQVPGAASVNERARTQPVILNERPRTQCALLLE